MTGSFDALADAYDSGRLGYASEVYELLLTEGLTPCGRVLDVGTGTGLAAAPLIENGFAVTGVDVSEPMLAKARARFPQANWLQAPAEALPFEPGAFDAAISAQTVHLFDRRKALAEMTRVVKSGGLIAMWWKDLTRNDPARVAREAAARELGAKPREAGLSGGFREFYAAPFASRTLRVIPWRTAVPLDRFLTYERSRGSVRGSLRENLEPYVARVGARLRERLGGGNPMVPLTYTHYVYVAKTR